MINGEVQTKKIAKFKIPFFTEDVSNYFTNFPPATFFRGIPKVSWQIKHRPPIWATHYAWVRTKNLAYSRYTQFAIQQAIYVSEYQKDTDGNLKDTSSVTVGSPLATEIYLNMRTVEFFNAENSDSVVSSFVPEPNDRLRFIAKYNPANTTIAPINYDWTDYIDVPIRRLVGDWLVIGIDDLPTGTTIAAGDIFEFYTPKLEQRNTLFYEIGEVYRVINPNTAQRCHGKGYDNQNDEAQDQDPTTPDTVPATGVMRGGDMYYRTRLFIRYEIKAADNFKPYPDFEPTNDVPNKIKRSFFIEDQSVSDLFYSLSDDTGRISIAIPENKQQQRNRDIRFSNKFLANTLINGLSSFEPLNEKNLPNYGSLNALRIAGKSQQDGNTMLAFMTTETLSMYINEAVIKQTGNAGQLTAIADDVIATVNELQGGYGCQHPESIVGNQNFVYWFDARKGVVCRYATNGLYPISNYGVSKYMLDKSLQLKTIPDFKDKRVFGGYDFIADEYILTFANTQEETELLPEITKETIGFYEPENRWSSFYSFTPDFYGKVGTTFISFVQGKLYVHNRDKNNYNTFYGVKYDSKIRYIMNEAPLNEKIYKTLVLKGSLSIEGTPPNDIEQFWYAEKFETNLNQLSTLFPENYEKDSYPDTRIESAFYAPILKNELTPNVTDPIFNGELMRGEVLIVHLVCKASKLCVLRFAQVGYLPSMGE